MVVLEAIFPFYGKGPSSILCRPRLLFLLQAGGIDDTLFGKHEQATCSEAAEKRSKHWSGSTTWSVHPTFRRVISSGYHKGENLSSILSCSVFAPFDLAVFCVFLLCTTSWETAADLRAEIRN